MAENRELRVPGDAASVEPLLLQVLAGLPDAVLLIDGSWRITYANRAARKLSRIEPENLNRETLWELYPEIVGTGLEEAYRAVGSTGAERWVKAFYYGPFKTWFDVRIFPMGGGVAVHYRDVTAIREAETASEAAAEHLRQVFDATTDAVLSVGRDWRFTFLNRKAKELLG